MTATLKIKIDGWENGGKIPGKFAFGVPASEGHVALSDNKSPAMSWSGAPAGTKSFAIICHDPDVPSSGEDVNQEGKTVPASLPRVDFYHWVQVDIPASVTSLAEGAASDGITAKGKPIGKNDFGVSGLNNYTDWFAGDADMGGEYGQYDGPCPPWNDSIVHHYHFTVYALDVESLGLSGKFGGGEALAAMEGHVLATGVYVGTYSMNPDVPA
ncbi:YbhB/YbcL family Raf kinase inhibitor-like protein [Sneathiella sp.]|jgi:Raf kinase inhibitor-like YbhB/YbcL family protein|uniref:YbhB/YbcL family Raf kinase inhibitor-like protein n=1 Tax=Sneathiella sp. TaxID=1964365 RepID=UPI0025EC0DC6|nr:YbhB/YbcL family Raf kinase inhibitor-like protein [Sneathiella sp.]|tara:strand:+ start:49 stop:687 length:639 start_codon:yes stop_codon:yes gene_type:complete